MTHIVLISALLIVISILKCQERNELQNKSSAIRSMDT